MNPADVPANPGGFWKKFLNAGLLENCLLSPEADGRGVRVALLDTGVNAALLEAKSITGPPVRHAQFLPGGMVQEKTNPTPASPHGTIVADVLFGIAPGMQLFSGDIFGVGCQSTPEQLVHAMRYAMDEWQCKIINLSLGLPEERITQPIRKLQLLNVLEEAYRRDVLVFAAGHNNHPFQASYPSKYESCLFSVNRKQLEGILKFRYAPSRGLEFQGHGMAPLAPAGSDPATSWATGYLSGYAARIASLNPGIKPFEMKSILYWISRQWENQEDPDQV